jgi:hypothetical protein
MSQKMTCPACASYTTAITTARDNGEPCPYCGADLLTGRKTATPLVDVPWCVPARRRGLPDSPQ